MIFIPFTEQTTILLENSILLGSSSKGVIAWLTKGKSEREIIEIIPRQLTIFL
jgi:hypothetical protein